MIRSNTFTVVVTVPALVLALGCGGAPDEQREHADRMAKEHAHDAPVANPGVGDRAGGGRRRRGGGVRDHRRPHGHRLPGAPRPEPRARCPD